MPRRSPLGGNSREWLRRAKSNLARARQPRPPDAIWEDFCFDAQQAVEKSVKALLVWRGITPPKIHDITTLLEMLSSAGHRIPKLIWDATVLSEYAVATRYPGIDPVTEEEYREAISIAEKVVKWAERIISRSSH